MVEPRPAAFVFRASVAEAIFRPTVAEARSICYLTVHLSEIGKPEMEIKQAGCEKGCRTVGHGESDHWYDTRKRRTWPGVRL